MQDNDFTRNTTVKEIMEVRPEAASGKIRLLCHTGDHMKVLIAIDSSECSEFALTSVTEHSWPKDAQFRIITVVEPACVQAPFSGVYADPMIVAQLEFEKYCHERITDKITKMKKAFPDHQISGDSLLGPPAETIIEEAKRWNADLLIVGSHGRRGISRFFLGSVAERVASHAPCSVEIVKQKLFLDKAPPAEANEPQAGGRK